MSHFLTLADAATIAIATQEMASYEVCSIENSSRKYVQDAESLYTRVSDSIKAQPQYVLYANQAPNAKYPQRSAVNYSKRVQQPFTQFSTGHFYPIVFFISAFDLCIGKNLSDQSSDNNTAFYFKDTKNKNILSLAKQSTLFGNSSRNGALQKDDSRHTPLRKMVSLRSSGSG